MVYTRKYGDYEERFEGTPEDLISFVLTLDGFIDDTDINTSTNVIYNITSDCGMTTLKAESLMDNLKKSIDEITRRGSE